MKRLCAALAAAVALAVLAGCSTDAQVVNQNISQDADNFKVLRRITFINGITDKFLYEVEGYCSIDTSNYRDITVTCATDGTYKRSYLGSSDNVTWIAEQLAPVNVSPNHYSATFKPETIVPDVSVR
jgi:hypothetical protein